MSKQIGVVLLIAVTTVSAASEPQQALTMVAHIASGEMSADAKWGKETLFYAVPSVAAGRCLPQPMIPVDRMSLACILA